MGILDDKEDGLIISGNVGNKIKKARLVKGIKQKTLAKELEVSPQAVSGWERGEALPAPDKRKALCELLGVTQNELFFDNPNDSGIFFAPFYNDESANRRNNEKFPLPVNFIDKTLSHNSVFCAYNHGDSMNSVLSDGAVVAIDTKLKKIENGSLYLVKIDNKIEIRALSLSRDYLHVNCLNDSYDSIKLSTQQLAVGDFTLIGKVFWYSSSIK